MAEPLALSTSPGKNVAMWPWTSPGLPFLWGLAICGLCSIEAFLGPEAAFCSQFPALMGAYSLQNGLPLLPHPHAGILIPVSFPSSFMILDDVFLTRTKFRQCSHLPNVKSPLSHPQMAIEFFEESLPSSTEAEHRGSLNQDTVRGLMPRPGYEWVF